MDSFTLPLKLTCTVSGKVVAYTSKEYVEKRLAKFGGSLERMRKEFVCRDAKRESTPVQATKVKADNGAEITIATGGPIEAPVIKHDFKLGKPIPLTKDTAPTDSCFNPGWFISKKACMECAFTGICNFTGKRVAGKK